MPHLLEVNNLTAGIKKDGTLLQILNGVNFFIDEGEIVGLTGESGCGKTMTALSISNLLPDPIKILDGEVLFNDIPLTTLTEKELCSIRGKEISVIFQDTRQSLNPLMRVGAQITEMPELSGSADKTRALETLASLGFEEPELVFESFPHQLSGGMCQRVMAAIAAIRRPRLLLADEPSSAQDMESQQRVLSLLIEMNRKYKTSVLIISHDLSIIRQFCSRFLVMRAGKIIEESSTDSHFSALYPYGNFRRQENQTAKTALLSIRNVSFSYTSRRFSLFGKKEITPVLNDINLELQAGEIFGLTGKSGCGKTTLALCIAGLLDYEGEILLDGQKQKKPPPVQMLFQEAGASLNPTKKIGWLIEEPLVINKRYDKKERWRRVDEMLNRVGLDPSFKTRRVHELSGGQKQRVCLARALMLSPRLLIADEAISSLDIPAGIQILDLLRKLNKNFDLTILFISHNKDAVKYLCDRIAVMAI
jgi:peptide/nickel transport system ATP-binding protein